MKKNRKKKIQLSDSKKQSHELLMQSPTKQVESRFVEIPGSAPNEGTKAAMKEGVAEAIAKTVEFMIKNV